MLFARDDEETVFVRHTASDKCRVLWREYGYVGVSNGLTMLVNDVALVAWGSLLQTFNNNLLAINRHADGIEAYHLTDSIWHGLAMHGGGDAEVLQLVVEEVDAQRLFYCRRV